MKNGREDEGRKEEKKWREGREREEVVYDGSHDFFWLDYPDTSITN